MSRPLYQRLAVLVEAIQNCDRSDNTEWREKHCASLNRLCEHYLPHGSGLDAGPICVDVRRSTPDRLLLMGADFHHMNENGYYDGWSEHDIIVTPSLSSGLTVKVTGHNRDGIVDYLTDLMRIALSTLVAESNLLGDRLYYALHYQS